MSPRYTVQRTNAKARRFEWLAVDPSDRALLRGDDLDWTPDADAAPDLGHERASEIVSTIAGASLVRFGDAPVEEAIDFEAQARERAAAERSKRVDALMGEALKVDDVDRAHDVLDLMSDADRKRWSAPLPEQDAAASLEDARRAPPSFMAAAKKG